MSKTHKNKAKHGFSMLSEPWCLSEMAAIAIAQGTHDVLTARDWLDEALGIEDVNMLSVTDGIGTIAVNGVMVNKAPQWMQKYMGAVGTDDIVKAVQSAKRDDNVKGILLHIDSPGGMAQGTPELADAVVNAGKPVVAFTDGCCASGAYWLASAASVIVATPSATVGSIGVYVPVVSYERMYQQAGIDVDVVRSGRFKGANVMGTALTPEQRANFQEKVDFIYSEFSGFVARRRMVESSVMQGQDFWGAQAQGAGLVDDIAGLDHAMSVLRDLVTLDKSDV